MTVDDIRPPQACDECGHHVDPYGYGVLQSIEGWVENRRGGGGVHNVRFKVFTGKVMCPRCARVRKETGHAAQGSLV